MAATTSAILSLDVGDRRVGIATASLVSRLPRPLTTLVRDERFFDSLDNIIKTENAKALVIGLPRDMHGRQTAQTEVTEEFIHKLHNRYTLPLYSQDEALTSRKAEAELKSRGKPYRREDIDALAATYILEDFLIERGADV